MLDKILTVKFDARRGVTFVRHLRGGLFPDVFFSAIPGNATSKQAAEYIKAMRTTARNVKYADDNLPPL